MGVLTAAQFVQATDKLAALFLDILGGPDATAALGGGAGSGGIGAGDPGGTYPGTAADWGASARLTEYENLIGAWGDVPLMLNLLPAAESVRLTQAGWDKQARAYLLPILRSLASTCGATGLSGVADIDTFASYYNIGTGGMGQRIVNTGAETGDFTGWTQHTAGGTFTADTSDKHAGTYSFKIVDTADAGTGNFISQDVVVSPGESASFTFWVKGTGWYQIYDVTNSADIVAQTNLGSIGTWTLETIPVTVPAGCTSVRVYLGEWSTGGTVRFDDVSWLSPWNALLSPSWRFLHYAVLSSYPSAPNVFFEVLQGSVYANGLRKLIVGTGQTAGYDIDSTAYAGGYGRIKWTGATGTDTVTVTGDWRKTDGTLHVAGAGTATLSGASGTAVLTPPDTNALLIKVTGIVAGGSISAGTIYAEAVKPASRANPPV